MKKNYICRTVGYIAYWLLSMTWGCIMTIIGLVAAIGLLITLHRPYRFGPNIYFKVGKGWGGVSFGPVVVISEAESYLLPHEAGHGVQNIIFGPLFPFLVAIPSFTRYWYREYVIRNGKTIDELPDYDAIWFEGQATKWGNKLYGKNNSSKNVL